jgi:excisionase family DNA binding protein
MSRNLSRNLISAKELAEKMNVNLITIYRATERGQLTNYGFGRSKRYDLNEILKINQ